MAAPGDLTDNVCPEMEGTRTPEGPCVTEGSGLLKGSDLSDLRKEHGIPPGEADHASEGESLTARCSEVVVGRGEGREWSSEGGRGVLSESSGPCIEHGSSEEQPEREDRNTTQRIAGEGSCGESGFAAGEIPVDVLPSQTVHLADSSSVVCVSAPKGHLQEWTEECIGEKGTDTSGGADTRQAATLEAAVVLSQEDSTNVPPQQDTTDVPPQEDTTDVTPQEDTTDVPPQEDTTDVPPQEDTTDVPPQEDTTDVPPQEDTTDVPPQEDTTDVPPQEDTTDVPPQEDTTDVPPQEDTTDVPPQEDTTDVPPQEDTTDVPPQEDTTDVPPQEDTTDVRSQEDTTDVPPQEDSTNVPPQQDTTDVPPQEDTTDVPPQEDSTDVPPQEDTTDVPPQEDTTDVPPQEDTTDVPPQEDTTTAPRSVGERGEHHSPSSVTACPSEDLTEGVSFAVDYLGSMSILSEEAPTRETRYAQTQEAIDLIKQPAGEHQPRYPVALEVSVDGVEVRVRETQEDLMSFPLVSISFVADTNDLLVVMAIKDSTGTPTSKSVPSLSGGVKLLKMGCHVFQSANARTVATAIGNAFQLAYNNFLKRRNIAEDLPVGGHSYESILRAQRVMDNELRCLKDKQKTEELVFPKKKGCPLGMMLIESGFGSAIPCCIIAALSRSGAAHQSGLLNVGDHVLALNGVTFVGLPLKSCLWHVRRAKQLEVVKMVVAHCPPVAEFRMFRPDTKYPLGFSVKDGLVCSLTRSTIADRCGVRVGHQIIEINGRSVVDTPHEDIVQALTSIVGDIHVKTMPDPIFRVMTGRIAPTYL